MNRAASSLLISLASLALSAAASPQTATQSTKTYPAATAIHVPDGSPIVSTQIVGRPTTLTVITLPSMSCPVGLRAEPGVNPGTLIVVTGNDSASQKLNLQLSNPRGVGAITHAQITVHGITAQTRISPATSGNLEANTTAKQVDLALSVAPGANTSTDLLFQGFTSVRWIDLDSLTYADGSTWKPSPQHNCRIVPSRFMLAASN